MVSVARQRKRMMMMMMMMMIMMTVQMQLLALVHGCEGDGSLFIASRYHVPNQLPFPVCRVQSRACSARSAVESVVGWLMNGLVWQPVLLASWIVQHAQTSRWAPSQPARSRFIHAPTVLITSRHAVHWSLLVGVARISKIVATAAHFSHAFRRTRIPPMRDNEPSEYNHVFMLAMTNENFW